MTSSAAGPRSSKALPKAKLAPKKSHSHCLAVCCWSDPLQLSESRWNLYICEVCSANQWDTVKTAKPAASIDQEKGPNSFPQQHTTTHTTNTSKVERIGLWSFASSTIFTWPLTNYHFFKHLDNFFAGKIHNQQDAENAFQEFLKSWNTNFYATGINKLISHWQTCADLKRSGYMYMYNQFILLYSWN